MKVADSRWLSQLAGEYVLGTLRGVARRRFERELDDPKVSSAVSAWESRLLPLVAKLESLEPRVTTWPAIEQRLGFKSLPRRARSPGWRRGAFAIAAVIAIVAIGSSVQIWHDTHQFRDAATVAASDGRPLWQLEVSRDNDELRVTVLGAVQAPPDKDFELWALPDGGSPVSLGLLPASGRIAHGLDATQRRALTAAHKVAVSVEPRGGSTTGAPTGPVVHVVPVRLAGDVVSLAAPRS